LNRATFGQRNPPGSAPTPRPPAGVRAVLGSVVIVAVLLLQCLASFDLFPILLGRPTRNFWPFLDYPMYSRSYREGSTVEQVSLVALCEGGVEQELQPSDFALTVFQFRVHLTQAVLREDHAALETYMAAFLGNGDCDRTVALRLERRPLRLRRHEIVEEAMTSLSITLP
jgi:hypothetical protein